VSNDSAAVWQTFNTLAVQRGGSGDIGRNETNYAVIPPRQQSFVYDPDGNLARDGCWSYEWDGENRLKAVTLTNVAGIPNASRQRLEFTYDRVGRRMTKTISVWNGSMFTNGVTTRFVYDGCPPSLGSYGETFGNLLAELNSQNLPLRTYLWGLDVSGTMDGAGGIGGLLMVTDYSSPVARHFVSYDGNGNVTALINAADNSTSALYEYGPFGEVIRASGPIAKINPFLFSSKYYDWETELSAYPVRPYSPRWGRWLSRDPIGEEGGLNRYAFVANSPIDDFDPFGLTGTLADTSAASGMASTSLSEGIQAYGLYSRVKAAVETFNDMQRILATAMEGDLEEAGDELLSMATRTLQARLFNRSVGMALGAIAPRFPSLKGHAAKHSELRPPDYYKDALKNMATGKKFRVKHDGQMKDVYITRLEGDKFLFTSASKNGKTVFTHMEVTSSYLRNKGITLPKDY
jgi:RHS repeat-associated protein